MNKKLRNLILLIIIFVLLLIFFPQQRSRAEAPEMTYDQKLDDYVYKLAICESRQNPSLVNPQDGGSPSYGFVQFKLGTFWNYNKKFNVFPELTIDNLHSYVMQKDKQVVMAKAIISGEKDGYKNWYNCTVGNARDKIGLPPEKTP